MSANTEEPHPSGMNDQNQSATVEDNSPNEQNQQMVIEDVIDEQPSTSGTAPAAGGSSSDAILTDYSDDDDEMPGIIAFRKHYHQEWASAEHLFRIVLQTEEARDSDRSSPPSTPPSPMALSINIGFNAENLLKEENMRHLLNAIDRILPYSNLGREVRNDIMQYLDLDFRSYKELISKRQERLWAAEKMVETESLSASESDSA